jgi:hypothetical protein
MNLSSPMNSTILQQFSNIINAHYLCLLQMSHQIRSGSRRHGNVDPPSSHSSPPTPTELMQTLVETQRALFEDMHEMINDDNGSVR